MTTGRAARSRPASLGLGTLAWFLQFVFCAQPIVDVPSRFASSFFEECVRAERDSIPRGEVNTF